MKTTTPASYSSFLHTTPVKPVSSDAVKDAEAKKTEEENEAEEEVYILYGVLFNNGSEPVIASNITDSQVVEEVRSRLVMLARDDDKNSQEENVAQEKVEEEDGCCYVKSTGVKDQTQYFHCKRSGTFKPKG